MLKNSKHSKQDPPGLTNDPLGLTNDPPGDLPSGQPNLNPFNMFKKSKHLKQDPPGLTNDPPGLTNDLPLSKSTYSTPHKVRNTILEWLSPDDFEETQMRHLRKRFQGTGQWLLDDPRFQSWRDEVQSRLLWCYGAPGSGKTILVSLVIEHLFTRYKHSKKIATIFIYCNYTNLRSPHEYIRLAIKQLCQRTEGLFPQLIQMYNTHSRCGSQPGFQELRDAFLTIVKRFDTVYLVVDALDECTLDQRAHLCEFFTKVVEYSSGANHGLVKLFVASRKIIDIERVVQRNSFPQIEVEVGKADRDIYLYVKAQIEQPLPDGSSIVPNNVLKDEILIALTTNASGMFLWAELKLHAVKAACLQGSENEIKKAIHNIPMDLAAYYDRIWDSIGKKPSQRDLATKALLFVAYATEPVSIDVLALAIAVNDHTQSLDMLRYSTAAETILSACGNLLSIDTTDPFIGRVCFIHFSVREYLTNDWPYTFAQKHAHREIARMCMVFLLILYSQIRDHCTDIENSFANDYILPSLPHHLLAGEFNSLPPDHKMVNLTSLFFREGPPMLAPPDESYPTTRIFFTFSQSASALIFNLPVTHQCFDPQVENQLDQSVLTWVHGRGNFVQVPGDRFAIHYATGQLDSVDVCQRLHTHGYPIGYSHHDSISPLSMVQVWQEQLIPSTCTLTPLYLVKSESVARFLVGNNASVNPQVENSKLPDLLGHLARDGNTEVIRLLLHSGAKQDTESQSSTLQNLASRGKVEAIQLFLDNGVDVNIQGGLFGNMLQAAAYRGHVEVMQILLDRGAHVNAQGGEYGNALQAAAYRGHVEALLILLEYGADVNAQGGIYGTALQAALAPTSFRFDNHLKNALYTAEILLDYGADPTAHIDDSKYGDPLSAGKELWKNDGTNLTRFKKLVRWHTISLAPDAD